jgi:ATP-dependent RNA helicase DDX27
LRQEIVKITDHEDRMATLCVLLEKAFKKRTIVFFKTKEMCHRASIILGLKGKSCTELHGNLNQSQRIEALEEFKNGSCEILLASDLVSRGLDIKNVRYVINFELPQQLQKYIHRVGRTARAGESGVCLTICDSFDLAKLKGIIKSTKEKLFVRPLSLELLKEANSEILEMDESIKNVYKMEYLERELAMAEREAEKAKNMLKYSDSIYAR